MPIISKKDFSTATGISKLPFPGLASFLMKVLKINEFNNLIEQAGQLKGPVFAENLLNKLGVKLSIDPDCLSNIPTNGAFIAIANHPYGAIESLAMLQILATHRPDTMFMGNFLLKQIPNLSDYIVAVNPFDQVQDASSITGLKTTLLNLKNGIPVAIFPAGEVSSLKFKTLRIADKEWHPVVGKIISKAKVPVLPVYFHGNNGLLFSLLKTIHPSLQTAKLISELFNKKGHCLRMSIGSLVDVGELEKIKNNSMLLNYLRRKTYDLADT